MHTAIDRPDNKRPAAISCLSVSKYGLLSGMCWSVDDAIVSLGIIVRYWSEMTGGGYTVGL